MLSELKIEKIRIDKSEFHFNPNFNNTSEETPLNVSYGVEMLINKEDERSAIILLRCGINLEEKFENVPFTVDTLTVGFFKVDKGDIKEYLINAISILIPYSRSHIATLTAISGIPPVTLPAINVLRLLEELKEQDEE
ncbi:hypothetical protein [Ureibacillus sp. FSL K6-3587]|jgi:preprotein translocase subunit SecB|uniref:hypothetical protein n=1 Tax=Ureibacillus sp. FSL K6-3587 TaxID=2954681 RepID=UPI0031583068